MGEYEMWLLYGQLIYPPINQMSLIIAGDGELAGLCLEIDASAGPSLPPNSAPTHARP